jgi:carboxylesterase type B
MQLGESIGCSGGSEELATCLKEKTPDELIDAQQKLLDLYVFPIRTAPVVDVAWRGDEGFLPGLPEELMDAGAFAQVPVMTGVVQDEGLMGYAAIHEAVGNDNFKNAEYFENELIPNLLKAVLDDDREIEVVTNAVKAQYFQGIDFENETKLAISELVEVRLPVVIKLTALTNSRNSLLLIIFCS